jgi:group I intron endonuclease
MISGIYKILNKVNNKFYVGSSINIKNRWVKHKALLRKNKHENEHLQHAWNLYGEDAFEFIVMIEVEEIFLLKSIEENIIQETKSFDRQFGYNKTKYTECPNRGRKMNEEQKKHLSILNTGRKMDEEVKKKISESLKGRVFTDETLKKMSDAKKGKIIPHKEKLDNSKRTKQFREKLSNFAKTRKGIKNGNSKLNLEKIDLIKRDLEENILKIQQIAEKYNVSRSTIKRIKYGKTYIN